MSVAKVELGRRLFYDPRLSINGQGSCSGCHRQELAFTDGRANAIGVTGELHARSSLSLVNVAYNVNYTWASRDIKTLEAQIRIPIFNERPVELGWFGRETALVDTLAADTGYRRLFEEAFPESSDALSVDNSVKALAAFVRTIISADSAFDRRLYRDDVKALDEQAVLGMRLFYSDKLRCGECHAGRDLSGGFHNTGITGRDAGLRAESGRGEDDGVFRAPTLRNIALTAPYMHDGRIATLSDVIDHYAAGGQTNERGLVSRDDSTNDRTSPLITGFELSAPDKSALLGFLNSLTDKSVLEHPRFAAPTANGVYQSQGLHGVPDTK
jgi:cytochrome c peroxidase